ncbi:MAG TPA: hypothetical protein DD490_23555 [Acidobacteria bacterium]|nr:hypothetical protein [Acidobacteriota bacterium]
MRHQGLTVALALIALLAGAGPTGAQPKPCDIDNLPAATLLLPYFEVTLTDPLDGSALVAVTNTSAVTRIAHVTLWTNWAIPTVSFDIVLTPNDVQTFDLANLFLRDPILQAETSGCTGALRPGTLHWNTALQPGTTPAEQRTRLIQAHRGEVMPLSNGSFLAGAAQANGPDGVRGYVTIDVVNRCNAIFPSTPGYFRKGGRGIASDANALIGDVIWAGYRHSVAYGEPLVHIRAHPTAFKPGDYTFYGRYVRGQATDDRQALGRRWASRYLAGPIGVSQVLSNLLIWRDTKSSWARPLRVGVSPPWLPLPLTSFEDWDEGEDPVGSTLDPAAVSLATQRIDLSDPDVYSPGSPYGWLRMDLGHTKGALFGEDAQAWVVLLAKADNFPNNGTDAGVGFRAFPLTGRCK